MMSVHSLGWMGLKGKTGKESSLIFRNFRLLRRGTDDHFGHAKNLPKNVSAYMMSDVENDEKCRIRQRTGQPRSGAANA
ncbi:hypothetical protein [Burkholderia sp. 3C]